MNRKMSSNQKRSALTIKEKQMIVEIKENNPELKLKDIKEEFYSKTKRIISDATISKVLRNKESVKRGENISNINPSDISISKETIQLVDDARNEEKEVSESFVIKQAEKVVRTHKLNPSEYYFSGDWARNILKGKVDDQSILVRNRESQQNPSTGLGIKRLVGLSEGEKNSILEKSSSQSNGIFLFLYYSV